MGINLDQEEGHVTSDRDYRGVTTISFFHPSHNALPGYLLAALTQAIRDAGVDSETKIILLKSGGDRTFCAGASFDELLAIENKEQGYRFFSGFANVINACRTCGKIIVGRVQGKAVGGGVGVAAATDYCFATKYAGIRLSELAVGIGPFVIGPAVELKVGVSVFARLALQPKVVHSAEWALEHGLYHEVASSAEEMDEAIDNMLEELCSYNPQALADLKRVLWEGTEHWDELLAERARISGRLVLSDFAQNAIATFKAR